MVHFSSLCHFHREASFANVQTPLCGAWCSSLNANKPCPKMFDAQLGSWLSSGMLKPMDQEMVAFERPFVTVSERSGHTAPCRATGEAPGFSQEAEEMRENLAWVVWRRQDRAG